MSNDKVDAGSAYAYAGADYIIIAASKNYDLKQNFFDCTVVETLINSVLDVCKERGSQPTIVIKSTIPVGYSESEKAKFGINNVIFRPEFLRESKGLYDNLYPSCNIANCYDSILDDVKEKVYTRDLFIRD